MQSSTATKQKQELINRLRPKTMIFKTSH